jgi:5,10-methylenetetrahydromethanopterin reductase
VYDTPALHLDPWMTLARAADRTTHIGLGVASVTPTLRHVLVTASAIATLEDLAPGRVAVAVGSGLTARRALGQKPVRWEVVGRYVTDLRALLRGEVVDVDGAAVQMLHGPNHAPRRPIEVPILLAIAGPKGRAVAEAVGDGVISAMPDPGFDRSVVVKFGTVLDDGEEPVSPRVRKAAGPGAAFLYHLFYELGDPAFDQLPNSAVWRTLADTVPPDRRHLQLHRGHLTALNPWDEQTVDPGSLPLLTLTGPASDIRSRVGRIIQSGASEICYQPMGDELERELHAFHAAVVSLT